MASKTAYTCSQCNYHTVKWLGCCPSCNEWDTLSEITASPTPFRKSSRAAHSRATPARMICIKDVEQSEQPRMVSGINEWDRVTGGGLVPGSLSILTGDPGIGKSTLLLHVAKKLAQNHRIFYFSTEESLQQVSQRANRIGCAHDNLFLSSEAELESIISCAIAERPALLLIDSIQNCYVAGATSTPGSISQLREATFQLMRLAKDHGITTIVTGHITKEGVIAGPKMLEHMVDAVFYLQGEDRWHSRALRAVKNRFGAVNELGFFEMKQAGLKELPNINAQLLSDVSYAPGSALISVMEGSRPLMLELQALTIESKLAMPQRVISGVDHKQVILIAAILQKYLQIKLNTHDIFFKVGGGFAIKNSTADLGIALALLSSYLQQAADTIEQLTKQYAENYATTNIQQYSEQLFSAAEARMQEKWHTISDISPEQAHQEMEAIFNEVVAEIKPPLHTENNLPSIRKELLESIRDKIRIEKNSRQELDELSMDYADDYYDKD